mgnify:CR=1 FL=1
MLAVVLGLSLAFGVPYFFSLLGFAAWAFFGHLITLDDDMPGEWSNLEKSKDIWRSSQVELGVKFVVLVSVFLLVAVFPSLKEFGAN